MKTLLKKHGIAAAAALLVLSVILVIGCDFTNPKTGGFEGTGILLSIKSAIGRTIMPVDTEVMDTVTAYRLVFTADSGGATRPAIWCLKDDLAAFYNLVPGDYTLTVTAYSDETPDLETTTNNTIVVATGTETFTVANNAAKPVTVILSPSATAGNGKLSYNITVDEGTFGTALVSSSMALTHSGGATPTPIPLNGQGPWANATPFLTLSSGYYRVLYTIDDGAGNSFTWRDLLHIYQNITTKLTQHFTDDYLGVKYTVTYHYNYAGNGTGGPADVEVDCLAGGTIDTLHTVGPDFRQHYTFNSWDTTYGGGTTWNTSTPINDDLHLYAQWTQDKGSAEIDIEIDLNDVELQDNSNSSVIPNESTVQLGLPSDSITIKVTHPVKTTIDGASWYFSNAKYLAGTPDATGTTHLFTAGAAPFTSGTTRVYIEAYEGSVLAYQTFIDIEITP